MFQKTEQFNQEFDRLKYVVIERPSEACRYQVTAAFETATAASDYVRFLRTTATNMNWDACFVHRSDERLRKVA